jgi:hypothetical protein
LDKQCTLPIGGGDPAHHLLKIVCVRRPICRYINAFVPHYPHQCIHELVPYLIGASMN